MWVSPNHPDYERLTRGAATAAPPQPTGELLASFPRTGPDGIEQELRVVLDAYQGHAFVGLRLWQRDQSGGWWPMKGKGLGVRMGEARGVAEALMRAIARGPAPPRDEPHAGQARGGRREPVDRRTDWLGHGYPPPPQGPPDEDPGY